MKRPRPSRRGSIRQKMILAFLPAVLILLVTGFLSNLGSQLYFSRSETIFAPSARLNHLITTLEQVTVSLEGYLSTRHFESLNSYLQSSSFLRQLALDLGKGNSYDEGQLLLRDIATLIRAYLDAADKAMAAKRSRDIQAYVGAFQESQKISGFIERFTDRYNRQLLDTNTRSYLALSTWMQRLQLASFLAIIGIALLDFLLLVWLTWRITNPLVILAESANRVANGEFEIVGFPSGTDDEIAILATAYENMMGRIRQHIIDVQEKSHLQQLLREAELHALQSQINPHFIFNTLNAGMQLAMFENAERTSGLMGNLSRLLRYNLRNLDVPVSLREELETCRSYIAILKTRFADLLDFREDIDPDSVDIIMPGLIIQPILENAWIHGISRKAEGGSIILMTRRTGDEVLVSIRDNGLGTPPEEDQEAKQGHASGIGMSNVAARLRLFYGRDGIIRISSVAGEGTVVSLQLYYGGAHETLSNSGQ